MEQLVFSVFFFYDLFQNSVRLLLTEDNGYVCLIHCFMLRPEFWTKQSEHFNKMHQHSNVTVQTCLSTRADQANQQRKK